jgi:hypothetical protein
MLELIQIRNGGSKPSDMVASMIEVWFHALAVKPFRYAGRTFQPVELIVKPDLFLRFECKLGCGACCSRATLDWLPGEKHEGGVERQIEFNGEKFPIISVMDNCLPGKEHCKYLNRENYGCELYSTTIPFHCSYPAGIRFRHFMVPKEFFTLSGGQEKAGVRNMMQADMKTRGGLCSHHLDRTEENTLRVLDTLEKMLKWVSHFKLESRLPSIIKWAEDGARTQITFP